MLPGSWADLSRYRPWSKSFVLGPLAGVFEFVPVVGPALASITVFLIYEFSGDE